MHPLDKLPHPKPKITIKGKVIHPLDELLYPKDDEDLVDHDEYVASNQSKNNARRIH